MPSAPPPTLNHFLDAQEKFWDTIMEDFEQHEIADFKIFFNKLFYLPDNVTIHDPMHPLNQYGADSSTNENKDRLRVKITENGESCPNQLLSSMFEDEDHPIYEALVEMIRKYRDLGNYIRDLSDSD
jgi:F0F1-type ATP synthase gamma subunit